MSADERLDAQAYRWMRPLVVVVIGFLVTTAFQTKPGPGLHGEHLAVSAALVVFVAATLAVARLTIPSTEVVLALLVAAVVSAAALVGLQPGGPGFLGVFPAVASAALRLPFELSAGVLGVAVAALAASWALWGHHPASGIVLNELGVAAFFILARFARRLRESNEQAERLIAELEETRAAQAQAAALGERQRLAREMHDVLAHSLSGLVLNLESARLIAERGDANPKVADAIGRAHQLAKTGLEEARRAIGMLRDDALPGPQGLADLAAGFERDTGVPCALEVMGEEGPMSADGRLTVYRVAQEALTNIRKHACPARVSLHLAYDAAGTRLQVSDVRSPDAAGRSGEGSGYGLTGMRERAALLGGTLDAGPTDDGFSVELWLPA